MLLGSCREQDASGPWMNLNFGSERKMTSKPKKGWKSIVPLHLKTKSAAHFCLLPKAKSDRYGPGDTPVYLNVYDLTPMNGYVYWAGLGIFHSGVEGISLIRFSLFSLELFVVIYVAMHPCNIHFCFSICCSYNWRYMLFWGVLLYILLFLVLFDHMYRSTFHHPMD